MDLENLVHWTRSKLSRFTGAEVPIASSRSRDAPTRGRAAVPFFDLFETESEFRLVVDVPGATPSNTHVAWNDVDTLSVHLRRSAGELDWYREILFPPDADVTKAHSTLRDGVLTVRVPRRRTTGSKLLPVFAA